MKFYETQDYLDAQRAKKEREIAQLKQKRFEAQVREFYWFMQDNLDTSRAEFLEATWKISFMGKTVELYNFAEVFAGIDQLLVDFMEEDGIEYSRGQNDE